MEVDLSVVVPLLNEEESLAELVNQVHQALEPGGLGYEIIFVDDGSTDQSLSVCRELHRQFPERVRALSLRRNQGKAAALAEGFSVARGRLIVTMDADLQDDPAEIPRLLEALDGGLDLVSGWKQDRQDPVSKTLPSRFFNLVTSSLTGIRIHDFNCGLKAYRREVTREIELYGELHRFLPVLAHWRGFRVGEIPVVHHARLHGRTKYGPARFLNGFLDLLTVILLTRYLRKPLHLFGGIGVGLILFGGLMQTYLVIGWCLGHWIGDRPLLPFSILISLTGVQLLLFGLVAELITANRADDRAPVSSWVGFDRGSIPPAGDPPEGGGGDDSREVEEEPDISAPATKGETL